MFSLLLAYLMTQKRRLGPGEDRERFAFAKRDGPTKSWPPWSGISTPTGSEAEPVAVNGSGVRAMLQASGDASLVLVSLRGLGKTAWWGPLGTPLSDIAYSLPLAAFTMTARELDLEAAPEEGPVAQVARTVDKLERRRDLLKRAEGQGRKGQGGGQGKTQLHFQEPDTIFQGEMFDRLRGGGGGPGNGRPPARAGGKGQGALRRCGQDRQRIGRGRKT